MTDAAHGLTLAVDNDAESFGWSDPEQRVVVKTTLDIAMYNTTKTSLVQAVERAVQRGVSVRYKAEGSNSNSALQGTISFPVLYREADGIMHNKFIIDLNKAIVKIRDSERCYR